MAQIWPKYGPKRGQKGVQNGLKIGSFLEHLLSTIGPFKGLSQYIWAKGPPKGSPRRAQKGVKKGSFWTPFWAIFGPLFEHLLSTIGPFKGLSQYIWAKGPQKGVPDMDQKGVKKGSAGTPSVGGSS